MPMSKVVREPHRPSTGARKSVDEIHKMIDDLREKNKNNDPDVDVDKELRRIQDKCADLKVKYPSKIEPFKTNTPIR